MPTATQASFPSRIAVRWYQVAVLVFGVALAAVTALALYLAVNSPTPAAIAAANSETSYSGTVDEQPCYPQVPRWAEAEALAADDQDRTVRQRVVQISRPVDDIEPCAQCGAKHRGILFSRPKTTSGEDRMVDLDEGSVGVLLAHHLTPQLGRLRLRDLRPGHVEAMLRAVKAGPSTRRRVHATLRSALSDAKRRRLVPYNAAVDAAVPAASRPKVRPWEAAELGRFLDAVASHRLDALRDGDPVQGDGAAAGGALRGGRPRPCCLTRGAAG